jgi:hypothetical protein
MARRCSLVRLVHPLGLYEAYETVERRQTAGKSREFLFFTSLYETAASYAEMRRCYRKLWKAWESV